MQEVAEEAKRDSEYKRSDINLDCRFYKKKFPEENDYVKVFLCIITRKMLLNFFGLMLLGQS